MRKEDSLSVRKMSMEINVHLEKKKNTEYDWTASLEGNWYSQMAS